MISDFLETIRNVNTRRAYVRVLNEFIEHLDGTILLCATRADVESYLQSLTKKGAKIATYNSALAALRAFYAYWEGLDETFRSPASLVRPIPTPEKEADALPERDAFELLRAGMTVVRLVYEKHFAGESDIDAAVTGNWDAYFKRAKSEAEARRLREVADNRTVDERNALPKLRVVRGAGCRFALPR